jgi:hypothetical protein
MRNLATQGGAAAKRERRDGRRPFLFNAKPASIPARPTLAPTKNSGSKEQDGAGGAALFLGRSSWSGVGGIGGIFRRSRLKPMRFQIKEP